MTCIDWIQALHLARVLAARWLSLTCICLPPSLTFILFSRFVSILLHPVGGHVDNVQFAVRESKYLPLNPSKECLSVPRYSLPYFDLDHARVLRSSDFKGNEFKCREIIPPSLNLSSLMMPSKNAVEVL